MTTADREGKFSISRLKNFASFSLEIVLNATFKLFSISHSSATYRNVLVMETNKKSDVKPGEHGGYRRTSRLNEVIFFS